jgi:hypothetical protein
VGDGILLPGEISVVTWELIGNETGYGNIVVKVFSDNGSDAGWLNVAIAQEEENIGILNLEYPRCVHVYEEFNISFTAKNNMVEYNLVHVYSEIYLPKESLPYPYLSTHYYGISTSDTYVKHVSYWLAPNETVNVTWNLTAINKGRYIITIRVYEPYWGKKEGAVSILIEVYDTGLLNVTYNNVSSCISITTNVNFLNPIFNITERKITFILSGANGTKAVCNLTIPKSIIPAKATIKVYIDNKSVNFVLTENSTCYFINFTCPLSRKYITIAWELPEISVSGISVAAVLISLTTIILALVILWLFVLKKKKLRR